MRIVIRLCKNCYSYVYNPVPPFVEIDALALQWLQEDALEANESMATASSRNGPVVIARITKTPLFEPIWCAS